MEKHLGKKSYRKEKIQIEWQPYFVSELEFQVANYFFTKTFDLT